MSTALDRRGFLIASAVAVGVAALPSGPLGAAAAKRVVITSLKVDFIERPLGVENLSPRFFWHLTSTERSVHHTRPVLSIRAADCLGGNAPKTLPLCLKIRA
jgi:hypothetical protein